MRKLLAATLTVGLSLSAVPSFAETPEESATARQAFYKSVGAQMGALTRIVRGDYDADAASATAAELLSVAQTFDPAVLYMEGSSKEELPGKTRALKKIWDEPEAFGEVGTAFYGAIVELNEVAGTGEDAFKAAFGKLGGTCKACHDDFRAAKF